MIYKRIGWTGSPSFDVTESSRTNEVKVVDKASKKHDQLVRKLNEVKTSKSRRSSVGYDNSIEDFGTCSLHHQKMFSFCIQDVEVVCHKCLLYGDHKFHESLDLEDEEDRLDHL